MYKVVWSKEVGKLITVTDEKAGPGVDTSIGYWCTGEHVVIKSPIIIAETHVQCTHMLEDGSRCPRPVELSRWEAGARCCGVHLCKSA